MAPLVHGTKSITQMVNNFPQYRWEAICLCGWATKNATKDLAEGQLNAHLQTHGSGVEVQPPAPKIVDGKPTGTWVPKGAKAQGVKPVEVAKTTTETPKSSIKPLGGGA